MLLLAACGGISESDIEATVEARVTQERDIDATVEARAKAMIEATAEAAPTAKPVPPTAAPTLVPATPTLAQVQVITPLPGQPFVVENEATAVALRGMPTPTVVPPAPAAAPAAPAAASSGPDPLSSVQVASIVAAAIATIPTPAPAMAPVVSTRTPTQVPPTATPSSSLSPAQVGGRLSADTTWTVEQSPYLITDTIEIPKNITLTIEEGVTVKAEQTIGNSFLIRGTFIAEGTSEKPIIFDANGTNLFVGLNAPDTMSVTLNHTHLKNGISIWPVSNKGSLHLTNSIISDMISPIYSVNHREIVISHNVFNNSGGFNGHFYDMSIKNNRFMNKSGESWISFLYWDPGEVTYITKNIWIGGTTYLTQKREVIPLADIEFNSFLDEGISIDASSSPGGLNPIARNNYWGTVDPEQIADKILDYNDELARGIGVDFQPFLTEPHPDTP